MFAVHTIKRKGLIKKKKKKKSRVPDFQFHNVDRMNAGLCSDTFYLQAIDSSLCPCKVLSVVIQVLGFIL